jgi:hypothetical protein
LAKWSWSQEISDVPPTNSVSKKFGSVVEGSSTVVLGGNNGIPSSDIPLTQVSKGDKIVGSHCGPTFHVFLIVH